MPKSKFTKELADQLVGHMEAGASVGEAATICFISRQSIWLWRNQGKKAGRGLKFELDRRIAKVEAEHIAAAEHTVHRIMRDRSDNSSALNAAKFFLLNHAAERYSERKHITVDQGDLAQQLLEFLRVRLDAQTYNRVLAAIAGGASPTAAEPTVLELPG